MVARMDRLGHPLGHKDGWSSDNRAFLRQMLTPEMIVAGVQAAAEILRGEPEGAMAARIAQDAYEAMDILTIQIEDLLRDLSCDESGHALGNVPSPASSVLSGLLLVVGNVREYVAPGAELPGSSPDRAANPPL